MTPSIIVGDKFELNCGSIATVTEYIDSHNIKVVCSSGYETTAESGQLRKGQVYDKFQRNVYGIGFLGSGKYGRGNFSYRVWAAMLQRCYSDDDRHPAYKDCTVCYEWQNFQSFSKWYYDNFVDGYDIDKDLKVFGNRVYSPSTCIFVPRAVNNFTKNPSEKKLAKLIQQYPEFCDILENYFNQTKR